MVTLDGAPWFVAADVAAVLGLKNISVTIRSKYIGDAERAKSDLGLGCGPMNVISESGLYKLVMRSDKPQAKDFQNWVTQTVLPSIRKDGGYVLGEEKVATGEPLPESYESIDESPQSVLGRCSMPCRRTPRQTAYFLFKSIAYCTFPG